MGSFCGIAGCTRIPDLFPMPAQKQPPAGPDPNYFFIRFTDRDAGDYIVRDIQTGDNQVWTFDHPELKFPLEPRPGLYFRMIFWIHFRTLHDTGPVTLVVKVNGHELGRVRCEHDGKYVFDQPVPMDWLRSGEPVRVLAEASPLWTSPDGGAHLGYLMEEAGFHW